MSSSSLIRVVRLNDPVSFRRAHIGREIHFPPAEEEEEGEGGRGDRWVGYFDDRVQGPASCTVSSGAPRFLDLESAIRFSRHARSSLAVRMGKEDLHRDFQISLEIRTFDQDGLIFALTVRGGGGEKKAGNSDTYPTNSALFK